MPPASKQRPGEVLKKQVRSNAAGKVDPHRPYCPVGPTFRR